MALENITGNESIEELQRLVEVFSNRIRLLDDKKKTTKPEIFEKVKSEYESRLLELQVMLEEKGVGIQEALEAALTEQVELTDRETEIRNEIEELDLRASIGEVEGPDYDQRMTDYTKEADEITLKLQELAANIDKYQKLNRRQPAQPAKRPGAAAVSRPPVPAKAPPKAKPALRGAVPPMPDKPKESQPNEIDELEKQFANILGSSFATTKAPSFEPAAPAESANDSLDIDYQSEVPATENGNHEGELECPKCGAFNRADNWYCEKCGNELINASDLLGGK